MSVYDEQPPMEPMAIIGMACRLPGGVSSPSDFWELLKAKQDACGKTPEDRFNAEAFMHPHGSRRGTILNAQGYFIDHDPRQFDHGFFGISPLEAKAMDPQQRQLLEVSYECFESAGYTLESISGSSTACFVGNFTSDYEKIRSKDPEENPPYAITGETGTILSNRLSYIYNLRGPSMTIDTACSSSLYALHMACNAISSGDASAALVTAANLIITPDQSISSTKLGVLSPSGRCHTFDEAADGYARGEAVGALLVKRLSDAVRDGDTIRAVIRATAVNACGKTSGITQPSAESQEAVIRQAYKKAGIKNFSDTAYFEFHGTGTPVGDPIEAEAISRVFTSRTEENPLLIGSVKTNLGHSEGASGLSAVIKVILAMENEVIPPIVGFETPSAKIPFDAFKMRVVQESCSWPSSTGFKRASINSFGFGGANAHVILESNPKVPPPSVATEIGEKHTSMKRSYLLPFSAQSITSLDHLKEQALTTIKAVQATQIKELGCTLATKRSKLQQKTYIIADARKELTEGDFSSTYAAEPGAKCQLAFVFTGQGAQWPTMGLELIDTFPVFRDTIEKLDNILQSLSSPPAWTITSALREPAATSRVDDAEYSQTLSTAVQIALVDLLASWNIFPCSAVGHSSGEIAAAYATGHITAAHAIRNAYARGAALRQNKAAGGAMLAVGLDDVTAMATIEGLVSKVTVACINSPKSVTLSGDRAEIERAHQIFDDKRIFNRILRTGGNAYHSHHMQVHGEVYYRMLSDTHYSVSSSVPFESPQRPLVPMFSSLTGERLNEASLGPSYWRKNLESTVRFSEAASQMLTTTELNITHVIELGPHPALQAALRDITGSLETSPKIDYLSTLRRNAECTSLMMKLLGELYLAGHSVDIAEANGLSKSLDTGDILRRLPSYPWNHNAGEILWEENRLSREWRFRKYARHDILGSRMTGTPYNSSFWRNMLHVQDLDWLKDHKLGSDIVFPAAGYLSMALEAARQQVGNENTVDCYIFRTVAFKSALVLPKDNSPIEILTSLRPSAVTTQKSSDNTYDFSITTLSGDIWVENATGSISVRKSTEHPALQCSSTRNDSVQSLGGAPAWYDGLAKVGLSYGPTFARLENICGRVGQGTCLASLPKFSAPSESRYLVHPTDLDACLQSGLISASGGRLERLRKGYVPTSADEIIVSRTMSLTEETGYQLSSTLVERGMRNLRLNCRMDGTTGIPLVELKGLVCTEFDTLRGEKAHRDPYIRIVWKPDIDAAASSQALSKRLFPAKELQGLPEILGETERLCLLCMLQLYSHFNTDRVATQPYLVSYWSWIKAVIRGLDQGKFPTEFNEREKEINTLSTRLRDRIFESRVVELVYRNFPQIWRGETSVLDVLVKENALNQLYEQGMGSKNAYQQLRKVIDLIAHKDPRISILEIGAGTGGASRIIFDELSAQEPLRRYGKYTYTDVSAGFLTKAQDEFKGCGNIDYRVLDITAPPEDQGFEDQAFDIILAANVLHATADIDRSLKHCNALLKPGGKLLLLEVTRTHVLPMFMLGLFPGFWQDYQDGRTNGPFLDQNQWPDKLQSAGFGTDFIADDYPYSSRLTSLLVSTKNNAKPGYDNGKLAKRHVTLVYRKTPHSICNMLEKELQSHNLSVEKKSLSEIPRQETPLEAVVCTVELEDALLVDIDESEFESLKFMTSRAKGILWLTAGNILLGADARQTMMTGIGRTLMSEQPSTVFWSLDLSSEGLSGLEESLPDFVQGFLAHVGSTSRGSVDCEYVLRDGQLHISRLLPDHDLNSGFRRDRSETHTIESTLESGEFMLDMENLQVGLIDSVKFTEDARAGSFLGKHEVEIRLETLGLNMKDVLTFMGNVDQRTFGQEVAGTVLRVGQDVQGISPGDRVLAFTEGQYNTLQRTDSSLCQRLQSDETFVDMATLPIVYATVLYGLEEIARIQPGESLLITAAAGGVGLAALQYAKTVSADVFCTVSSTEKREFLHKNYGVPYSRMFDSRKAGFSKDLLEATGGKGVDVILSSVAGELLHETWRCIASFGRFIDIGRRDVLEAGRLELSQFRESTSFTSFDLMQVFRHKRDIMARLLATTVSLYRQRKISSIKPVRVFDVSEMKSALRFFMKGVHIGKVVISFQQKQSVIPVHPRKEPIKFRKNASYLLVGCLGGLGRSLALWMLKHGAASFVFLSRSGVDKAEAKSLVDELRARNACVQVVRGDVTSKEDVERAVKIAQHPIHGVIQAAMVLRDGLFSKMSLDALQQCTRPKVQGTLNLHECTLDQPLDFFVMTSSLSGTLGTVTQSNYSAANSFLDSFARYRHSAGLPAASLSLGMVTGVGYVAEHEDVEKALRRNGFYGIDEQEFLYALGLSMRLPSSTSPGSRYDPAASAFILTGMEPIRLLELVESGFDGGTFWSKDMRLTHILRALEECGSEIVAGSKNSEKIEARARNAYASGKDTLAETVSTILREKLASLLLTPAEKVTGERRLAELGLDSMIAAEIRNWLYKEMCRVDIPFLEILNPGTSVRRLGERISGELEKVFAVETEK